MSSLITKTTPPFFHEWQRVRLSSRHLISTGRASISNILIIRWTCDWDVTQWLPFPIVNDSGKVSVGEVHQDDLAFRMNASLRKVLREGFLGILITEPNRWRSRIRWSGCPRTKRVLGRSRLTFRCHRHRLTQTEERGRERDNQKSPNTVQI